MSRPPIPTAIKKYQGTYNATVDRDHHDDEFPMDSNLQFPAPDCLSPPLVKVWNNTTNKLMTAGVLRNIDLPLLEQGFRVLEEAYLVNKQIQDMRDLEKIEPWTDAQFNKWQKLSQSQSRLTTTLGLILGKFGMTPSDRAKLSFTLLSADAIPKKSYSPLQRAVKPESAE